MTSRRAPLAPVVEVEPYVYVPLSLDDGQRLRKWAAAQPKGTIATTKEVMVDCEIAFGLDESVAVRTELAALGWAKEDVIDDNGCRQGDRWCKP